LSHFQKALDLNPEIETKIYQESLERDRQNARKDDVVNNNDNNNTNTLNENEDDENIENLIERFQNELFVDNRQLCSSNLAPGTIQTEKHISCLPVEVMILILKYVVSAELDIKSLERFGSVCKGFFLLSRENAIWYLACKKVWKNNLSPPSAPLNTWRDIFINRCRVLFDGVYISKINYLRYGENSFQDSAYRPVQNVTYFRLIRFCADGRLFMLTSADELQNSVNRLKNIRNAEQSREIAKGTYSYQDDHVLIVIKKTNQSNNEMQKAYNRKRNIDTDTSLTFFLELEITNSHKRNFTKLNWKNYSVSQFRDGEELNSEYDLHSSTKYPPFIFSHVKSFHLHSNECLQ
jgi:F-box protein 9